MSRASRRHDGTNRQKRRLHFGVRHRQNSDRRASYSERRSRGFDRERTMPLGAPLLEPSGSSRVNPVNVSAGFTRLRGHTSRLLPDNFVVAPPCSFASHPSRCRLESPSVTRNRGIVAPHRCRHHSRRARPFPLRAFPSLLNSGRRRSTPSRCPESQPRPENRNCRRLPLESGAPDRRRIAGATRT
jgi:hypothetical protein